MKPLFSALLEMIVLVVSILLVMLCAKLLKFDSSFDNYSEKYPDSIITVGNAMDYFPEGTDPTPEEAKDILHSCKRKHRKGAEAVLFYSIYRKHLVPHIRHNPPLLAVQAH